MASSEDSSHPSVYLYDEESSTYYYSHTSTPVINYQFNDGRAEWFNYYSLTRSSSRAYPKSWKLYGSNNGENWVILDEQSSISFSTSETKYFSLRSNPRSYNHYKLKITSSSSSSEVYLADWQGYSAIYANPLTPFNLFYPESTYSLQIYSVVDIEPFCDGQSVSFSISASLPNGLSFNTNNGHITGTPTESNSLTTYTITATNSQSTISTTLVMEITTLYCEVDDG